MTRYAGLYEVIEAHKNRTFAWGECDCCLFVARVRDAMHGTNLEQALLAEYDCETGALRYIASQGGLDAAVSHFLGSPTDQRAVRGSVVLIDGGEGEAVGVCVGAKVVAMGPNGLRYLPRSEIKRVWL